MKITRSADEIKAEIERVEQARAALIEKRKPLDDKIAGIRQTLDRLRREYDSAVIAASKTPQWNFLLDTKNESTERNRAAHQELNKIGLDAMGFWTETNQRAIKIDFCHNQNIKKTLAGIKAVIPFIKLINNEIPIGIQEPTCGEYGIYKLILTPNAQKCKIIKTTYGHSENYKEFDNWEEALTFIAQVLCRK